MPSPFRLSLYCFHSCADTACNTHMQALQDDAFSLPVMLFTVILARDLSKGQLVDPKELPALGLLAGQESEEAEGWGGEQGPDQAWGAEVAEGGSGEW